MTLMLFGNEHKEHWKTEVGSVIGVLNPNLMKQRDGYDGVRNLRLSHSLTLSLTHSLTCSPFPPKCFCS